MIKGLNNGEIAEKLNITKHTVKAHLSHVYEKMGVKGRVQATLKYAGIINHISENTVK
jgi:DNA-binding CsgD family transcriptional regulator